MCMGFDCFSVFFLHLLSHILPGLSRGEVNFSDCSGDIIYWVDKSKHLFLSNFIKFHFHDDFLSCGWELGFAIGVKPTPRTAHIRKNRPHCSFLRCSAVFLMPSFVRPEQNIPIIGRGHPGVFFEQTIEIIYVFKPNQPGNPTDRQFIVGEELLCLLDS